MRGKSDVPSGRFQKAEVSECLGLGHGLWKAVRSKSSALSDQNRT